MLGKMNQKKSKLMVVLSFLLIGSSCSHQSAKMSDESMTRAISSEDDCNNVVRNIMGLVNIQETGIKADPQNAIFDAADLNALTDQYGMMSDEPVELLTAFEGVYNGRMSLSVFQKLKSEYPNIQGSVSAIVFKDHMASLGYPSDSIELIKTTFDQMKKTFSVQAETKDYFIIDIPVSGAKDANFLGKISSATTMEPLIFSKDGVIPTNRFFKIPKSVVKKIASKITDSTDERLTFVNMLRDYRMTMDAANALIDFNGKEAVNLKFHVKKAQIEMLKNDPALVKELDGKFSRIEDSADFVVYKVIVKSKEDFKDINRLFLLSVEGKISLMK